MLACSLLGDDGGLSDVIWGLWRIMGDLGLLSDQEEGIQETGCVLLSRSLRLWAPDFSVPRGCWTGLGKPMARAWRWGREGQAGLEPP